MNYQNGRPIKAGDKVIIESGIEGVVVCDFDNKEYLDGYSDWDPEKELIGGGKISSGVLIRSKELGLVHYPHQDDGIVFASS